MSSNSCYKHSTRTFYMSTIPKLWIEIQHFNFRSDMKSAPSQTLTDVKWETPAESMAFMNLVVVHIFSPMSICLWLVDLEVRKMFLIQSEIVMNIH